MSIASRERPAETKPILAHQQPCIRSKTTPLYVVCSAQRGVGKTLLSRLLIEFHSLHGRTVSAFDLAAEGPQLADFIPDLTAVADISDIFGEMAFFDSLICNSNAVKVIDLSHQIFRNFFIVAQKIGFFEEVRDHAIEPVVLFIVDPDPKSAKAYSMLQRWFAGVPLLPVRNQAVARGVHYRDAFPNTGAVPVSPEMPKLSPSLKALVEQQSFSFSQFWRKAMERFPARLDDELRPWMTRIFFQFRQIDICLTGEDTLGGSELADIPQTFPSEYERFARVEGDTDERLAHFTRLEAEPASGRQRAHSAAAKANARIEGITYEADEYIRNAEADAGKRLQLLSAATDQATRLEAQLAEAKRRAERAEQWLLRIREEIGAHFIPSLAAVRDRRTERS